jgi:galactokinase
MDRDRLIDDARGAFFGHFGYEPQAVGVAPGRVELLGNHTDYNEGFVLTAAIDRAVAIAGTAREVPTVRLGSATPDFAPETYSVGDARKVEQGPTRWANYIKGVADELAQAGIDPGGFDAFVSSTVPDGSGVSSSAALLVATAQLLRALTPSSAPVDPMDLARLCRRAENGRFVGAPVGLLDQFSSVFGRDGHALFLDCRSLAWQALPLSADRCRILIADTGVKHALADSDGGYPARFAQCREAARHLTGRPDATLRDITPEAFEERAATLDPVLERRARHVIYENRRVEMGAEALAGGNLSAFGEMLNLTHESCQRLFENSCPEVDTLVELAQAQPGVYGAKLTGGGWGGCAVILHPPEVTDTLIAALTEGFTRRYGRAPGLLPTSAAAGAAAY